MRETVRESVKGKHIKNPLVPNGLKKGPQQKHAVIEDELNEIEV